MRLPAVLGLLTRGERLILFVATGVLVIAVALGAFAAVTTTFRALPQGEAAVGLLDSDGDGLADDAENLFYGTSATATDTDGDGLPDGWEARYGGLHPITGLLSPDPARADAADDPDADGLSHAAEFANGTDPDADDSDRDSLPDGWEVRNGYDPLDADNAGEDRDGDGLDAATEARLDTLDTSDDSDGDGLLDAEEVEGRARIGGTALTFRASDPAAFSTGGSGLADGFAVVHGIDPADPNAGLADPDDDGLTTADEFHASVRVSGTPRQALVRGLDPHDADTDGDEMPDGWESLHALDPLDPADGDGDPDDDGLGNRLEAVWLTDPFAADTDADALEDGVEVQGWSIQVNGATRRVFANPRLADTDRDGMPDGAEREGRFDGVTFAGTDAQNPDTDGDDLSDLDEVKTAYGKSSRTDPAKRDTDADGLLDGVELAYWTARAGGPFPALVEPVGACRDEARGPVQARDPSVLGPGGDPDGDCLPNIVDPDSDRTAESLRAGLKPLVDGEEIAPARRAARTIPATDPAAGDTDADGLPDEWEVTHTRPSGRGGEWVLNPAKADSDGDGIGDADEDEEEGCWTFREDIPWLRATADRGGDGPPEGGKPLANRDELELGTDPLACDSDRDGLVDGWETRHDLNALDPEDAVRVTQRAGRCWPAPATREDLTRVIQEGLGVLSLGACPDQPTVAALRGLNATLDLQLDQRIGTDPAATDTDGDGMDDAAEWLYAVLHGLSDAAAQGADPTTPTGDWDRDALSQSQEGVKGTDPVLPDTDGDGILDGQDPNPLLPTGSGGGAILDRDADFLLDRECQDGTAPAAGPEASSLRGLPIVELRDGVFLCEPSLDLEGKAADAGGIPGVPDAWELLWTGRAGPPRLMLGGTTDEDGDGFPDDMEYFMGRPPGWSEATSGPWWFGPSPSTKDAGTDADGDGLEETLLMDPDPYGGALASLAAGSATRTASFAKACQLHITCPGTWPAWRPAKAGPAADLATGASVGDERGAVRAILKGGDVAVTRAAGGGLDGHVAVVLMTASEAARLTGDGNVTTLARPERVLCILPIAGGAIDGTCRLEPGPRTATLPSASPWLGTTRPAWTASTAVADPLQSQVDGCTGPRCTRVVLWLLPTRTRGGTVGVLPVEVESTTAIQASPPDAVDAGQRWRLGATLRDATGDPLADQRLRVSWEGATVDAKTGPDGAASVELAASNVTTAKAATLSVTFTPAANPFLTGSTLTRTITIRPLSTLRLTEVPPVFVAGQETRIVARLDTTGGPVAGGLVKATLAGADVGRATTSPDGTAEIPVRVPAEAPPGPATLKVVFNGTREAGAADLQREVLVARPARLELAEPLDRAVRGETLDIVVDAIDSAGDAVARPGTTMSAVARLGTASGRAPLDQDGRAVVTLAGVDAALGPAVLELELEGEGPYVPRPSRANLTVVSPAHVRAVEETIARGMKAELGLAVTDALGDPVDAAAIRLALPDGPVNATVQRGAAVVALLLPKSTPPGPFTLGVTITGPYVIPEESDATLVVTVLARTTLSLDVARDHTLGAPLSVAGRLVDDLDAPVPAADITVTVGDHEETIPTTSSGTFQTSIPLPADARPGTLALEAIFPGAAGLASSEANATTTLRIGTRLVPAGNITIGSEGGTVAGRAETLAGEPLPAGTVRATIGGDAVGTGRVEAGAFRVPLALPKGTRGTVTLTLAYEPPAGYAASTASTTLAVKESVSVDAVARPTDDGIEVVALLRSPSGPLAGATVVVGDANGAPVSVTTNETGVARIVLARAPGTLTVRYEGDDTHAAGLAVVDVAPVGGGVPGLALPALLALIVLALLADAYLLARVYSRLRLQRAVDEILAELERGLLARDEIEAIVMNAYLRLRALGAALGVQDPSSATAREFADALVARTLAPRGPLEGFLSVFDRVRYGRRALPGDREQVLGSVRAVREALVRRAGGAA